MKSTSPGANTELFVAAEFFGTNCVAFKKFERVSVFMLILYNSDVD